MLLQSSPQKQISELTNPRKGEVKIGERVQYASNENWLQELKKSDAKIVLLGIPEDVGVRANGGLGGTHTLWPAALASLLNMQSTPSFSGNELFIVGAVDCLDWMARSEGMSLEDLRNLVIEIDERLAAIVSSIMLTGSTPIVLGGGHNNSFPLLKAAATARGDGGINCINLDAHSDYRQPEGRHSGNGFRYAWLDGYMERYAVVGLHENYNNPDIIKEFIDDPSLHASLFEDIFIREKITFKNAVEEALAFLGKGAFGVELDMDCITGALSSAATPCGISPTMARQYLNWCCSKQHVAYVHIAEGAVALRDGRADKLTGKLAAMLIVDAAKALNEYL